MRWISLASLPIFSLCWASHAVHAGGTITVEDTFTRADSTDLGVTEVGGFTYLEAGTVSGLTDVADIFENELTVFGDEGLFGSGPGVVPIDVDLADITNIAADMRFEGLLDPSNPGSNNVGGYILRRNGATPGFGSPNEGQVEIVMFPGGGLFVREINNGSLNTLLQDNSFGGSTDTNYSAPGQLPTTFNGLPFDSDGSGVLEEDEPFRFSASLIGSALDVQVNGQSVANLNVSRSVPFGPDSTPVLYKNRFTSAGGLDAANITFDNLVINGTEFIEPPPPPIFHQGDMDPLDENWLAFNGAAGVANNGPIDDSGTPAWNINDDSDAGDTRESYTRRLTDEQLAQAAVDGWRMKGTLRVVSTDDVPDGAIEMSVFTDNNVGYLLWLGADSAGNAIVAEFGGVQADGLALGRSVTLGSGGYHDYEMVFDPTSQTVDVLADGNLVIDDMLPLEFTSLNLNRILWGSNASAGIGEANYSFIEFIIGSSSLLADFDGNGVVDGNDLAALEMNFGTSSGAVKSDGDANGDGAVTGIDFLKWQQEAGSGTSAGNAASVPEPSGTVLVLLAATGALAARRQIRRAVR
ncbi:PEP-CTERM sorting domain-containing protein [Pirellulales bacterium]|nr:PEP-CTERM sorting domain-containing protein [Pirellulales bacterium]